MIERTIGKGYPYDSPYEGAALGQNSIQTNRPAEIVREMAHLREISLVLEKNLNRLGERLTPVLAHEPPSNAKDSLAEDVVSPVGQELASIRYGLLQMNALVESLAKRLAL